MSSHIRLDARGAYPVSPRSQLRILRAMDRKIQNITSRARMGKAMPQWVYFADYKASIQDFLDIAATKIQAAYRGAALRKSLLGDGQPISFRSLYRKDQELYRSMIDLQKCLVEGRREWRIEPKEYHKAISILSRIKERFTRIDDAISEFFGKKFITQKVFESRCQQAFTEIHHDIYHMSKSYGAGSLEQLRILTGEEKLSSFSLRSADLMTEHFVPTKWEMVHLELTQEQQYQIHMQDGNGEDRVISLHRDYTKECYEQRPFFIPLSVLPVEGLYSSIHAAELVVPIDAKRAMVIQGNFPNDPLAIRHSKGEMREYIRDLKDLAKTYQGPSEKFKERFLEQLSTRDLLTCSYDQIMHQMDEMSEYSIDLEAKGFRKLPRELIAADDKGQAKILSALIIGGHETLALMLYENLKEKAPEATEKVYDSMHYSLQKHIKEAEKEYDELRERLKLSGNKELSLESQVMASKMSEFEKAYILGKIKHLQTTGAGSSEGAKIKEWINRALQLPIGHYVEPPVQVGKNTPEEVAAYMAKLKTDLENSVHGHLQSKKEFERIVGQWVRNGESKGAVIAMQGPPGIGKTTFARKGIAKVLGRPFCSISLGGAKDSAIFNGHDFTYVGSKPGIIAEELIKAGVMNPVIYLDELDKLSQTEHGKEIIGSLMHILDGSQNNEFKDNYFNGLKLDLSRALFIISYNDDSLMDSILQDRMITIRASGHTTEDKLVIAQKYSLPGILKELALNEGDIIFPEEEVEYLIENYTYEAGVRRLEECMTAICRDINLEYLRNPQMSFPIVVDNELIHKCLEKPNIFLTKARTEPSVGTISGLYANSTGHGGGILIAQAFPTQSKEHLKLILTGSQGKVMQESVHVAKTVAWGMLPEDLKMKIMSEERFGLHLHFNDAAIQKDGPSAGGAITTAMVSQLTGVPIRHDIATTGEIDLAGNITAIGGLDSKLLGAKRAGVKKVLFPQENMEDFKKVMERHPKLIDENFTAEPINHISELLEQALVEHDVPLNTTVSR